ncbi:MAG: class I SAM-dependent methyltransferase [Candidatus Omnitrophica bacterium]|nr:class I SAM-dependent methyltransferase [Candidatus Omnitrophota bacterium]
MKLTEIERLYRIASKELKDKENFPAHFLYKKIEMENIFKKVIPKTGGICLEIGCGNGFQSALLSCFAKRLVATDLYHFDQKTHTMGMALAKDLNKYLNRSNVRFVACSATMLSFKPNSFDFILINSALEHIEDKKKAVEEIFYALCPGGVVVVGVPNFITDFFLFTHLYLYIIKRIFDIVCIKFFKRKPKDANIFSKSYNNSNRNLASIWSSFRKNYPSFPFPVPHGDWKDRNGKLSFFEEFKNSFPWKWEQLLKSSGLRVIKTFALLFVPFPIFEPFSTRLWIWFHNSIKKIHFVLCDSVLKYFSITYCLIAKKELIWERENHPLR